MPYNDHMANRKVEPRLSAIMHAYLEDIAALGAYGKGKSDVARAFIERGIQDLLEKKVIQPKAGPTKNAE